MGNTVSCGGDSAANQDPGNMALVVAARVDVAEGPNGVSHIGRDRLDCLLGAALSDQGRCSGSGVDWRVSDAAKCQPGLRAAALGVKGYHGRDASQREVAAPPGHFRETCAN